MEVIDRIMSLIGGSSGAGIIIATLVGMIKSVWKPKSEKFVLATRITDLMWSTFGGVR